ncbi:MAG: D-alanine--D-alanine ligase [Deltaproteobacteria bacterium]|jgi:D-alanine-D-alanine ligase|nr:D-alanine--D-alanine ligase [Deltaproteobacteria bacterium]
MQKMKIGIIMGGLSSEREVSLNSGRNVYDHLDNELYEGVPLFMDHGGNLWCIPWQLVSQNTTVDIMDRLEREGQRLAYEDLGEKVDFVFICLHGKYGDDGCIQGLLELLRIPYTGSGVLASALGMDKHVQLIFLKAAGLDVPSSMVIPERDWVRDPKTVWDNILSRFSFPLVVKPTREGSSTGVTIIQDSEELADGIQNALQWDSSVLLEEYLNGTEFSSIVLEEEGHIRALEVTEIHPQSEFYTYDDKYMPGRCRKFTPPKTIPPDVVEKIKEAAVRAFLALGFRSYGRMDGFLLTDGRILITDPNSSSGMAPSSFFFEQAACSGMLPSMIISHLIENAIQIHSAKIGPL